MTLMRRFLLPPIRDGEAVLRQMLKAHGVDPSRPRTVGETWEVFKEFVRRRFKTSGPESDGVLYETGIFHFTGRDEFYLNFTRQFEATDRGEHDHYEQLRCEFRFPVTEETLAFGSFHAWWFADDPAQRWEGFVALVEERPEFIALRARPPAGGQVSQEAV